MLSEASFKLGLALRDQLSQPFFGVEDLADRPA
jgi:hypothetical protein